MTVVGTNMTKSPNLSIVQANKILGKRKEQHDGSKWDSKVIGSQDLPLKQLRYKVGVEVVEDCHPCREVAKTYGVSKSFVSFWSRIYRARKRLNKRDHHDCPMENTFQSFSNRPHFVIEIVPEEIRLSIVKVRRQYPFFGSAKIKAFLGLELAVATIDKILLKAGIT